jgi:hypothetical protein
MRILSAFTMISRGRPSLNADWEALSRDAALTYEGNVIRVDCGHERQQDVHVEETGESLIRLWSRVTTLRRLAKVYPEAGHAERELCLINRYRELVGFKVNERRMVIGEAWVMTVDLTVDEWGLYVRTLAKACDRMEYRWTGGDRE